MNHDHIHILFYTKLKKAQTLFLRFIAAELGRKYKQLKKKFGISSKGALWRHRPFTRLVSWGKKSLQAAKNYIEKNRKEVAGIVAYEPREHRLAQLVREWNSTESS